MTKAWIVGNFKPGVPTPVIGDWIEIDLIHNAGGLFGMLQGTAPVFGAISLAVLVILVAVEVTMGWRSWLLTITVALLLGGAVGNYIDRVQYQYVVDFVDMGIGSWRFYIYNLADSAISVSLGLMLLLWIAGPWLEKRLVGAGGNPAAGRTGDAGQASDPADQGA